MTYEKAKKLYYSKLTKQRENKKQSDKNHLNAIRQDLQEDKQMRTTCMQVGKNWLLKGNQVWVTWSPGGCGSCLTSMTTDDGADMRATTASWCVDCRISTSFTWRLQTTDYGHAATHQFLIIIMIIKQICKAQDRSATGVQFWQLEMVFTILRNKNIFSCLRNISFSNPHFLI